MAPPAWKLDAFNQIVDTVASAALLAFFTASTIYLLSVLDLSDAAFQKNLFIITVGGMLSAFWWAVVFAARVVALDEEGVTIRWIYRRRSRFPLKDVRFQRSILRAFYIFEIADRTVVMWNHLGGAARLSAALEPNE